MQKQAISVAINISIARMNEELMISEQKSIAL
jgi:hypothetical protein